MSDNSVFFLGDGLSKKSTARSNYFFLRLIGSIFTVSLYIGIQLAGAPLLTVTGSFAVFYASVTLFFPNAVLKQWSFNSDLESSSLIQAWSLYALAFGALLIVTDFHVDKGETFKVAAAFILSATALLSVVWDCYVLYYSYPKTLFPLFPAIFNLVVFVYSIKCASVGDCGIK